MELSIEKITKYGINGLLFFALVWMNSRLDKVEQKLFDCYESRIYTVPKVASNGHRKVISENFKVAILPNNNDKRKRHEENYSEI